MIEIVRTAPARRETLWVVALALGVLALWALGVRWRAVPPDGEARRIDALLASLPDEVRALRSDLAAARREIVWIHRDEGAWPRVADLAAAGIPPFVPAEGSAPRGAFVWSLHRDGDGALYLGRPDSNTPEAPGTLLLLCGPREDEGGLFHHPAGDAPIPATRRTAGLRSEGWTPLDDGAGRP